MTVDPQEIGKRLREQRETTKNETSSLAEQLALTDVKIDEYDELINKIDQKIPPLVDPINQKIRVVQQAYLDRISHGCRSDLIWTQVATNDYHYYNDDDGPTVTYEVTKDPNTFRFLGFWKKLLHPGSNLRKNL